VAREEVVVSRAKKIFEITRRESNNKRPRRDAKSIKSEQENGNDGVIGARRARRSRSSGNTLPVKQSRGNENVLYIDIGFRFGLYYGGWRSIRRTYIRV